MASPADSLQTHGQPRHTSSLHVLHPYHASQWAVQMGETDCMLLFQPVGRQAKQCFHEASLYSQPRPQLRVKTGPKVQVYSIAAMPSLHSQIITASADQNSNLLRHNVVQWVRREEAHPGGPASN